MPLASPSLLHPKMMSIPHHKYPFCSVPTRGEEVRASGRPAKLIRLIKQFNDVQFLRLRGWSGKVEEGKSIALSVAAGRER